VTLLLDLGVPPHVVKEIVSHSAIEVTMTIYAHVSLDEKRKALGKLGEVVTHLLRGALSTGAAEGAAAGQDVFVQLPGRLVLAQLGLLHFPPCSCPISEAGPREIPDSRKRPRSSLPTRPIVLVPGVARDEGEKGGAAHVRAVH
jgi:hypothetical protein